MWAQYHSGRRMPVPPVFAAGALYDNLLQAALRRFLARAVSRPSPRSSIRRSARLSIEPTDDPCELVIRWFGTRHILRVPGAQPFTVHEVRMARAIGAVLFARYRAIFDPAVLASRADLFQGLIEDRYVGGVPRPEAVQAACERNRADRIARAIEVLRVAALSSYENRPISSGVLAARRRRPCSDAAPGRRGSTPSP